MTRLFRSLAVAAALFAMIAAPVSAQNRPPPNAQERAEKVLREGVERMLHALELLLGSIPQYEMPEVLDNGDIIIRRKHPARKMPPPKPKSPESKDESST